MKKEHPTIKLECARGKDHVIHYVGGPLPYLWLGDAGAGPTFGVVADKDVKRLREWTGRILAMRRKLSRRKAAV